jgi:hypothetical protein
MSVSSIRVLENKTQYYQALKEKVVRKARQHLPTFSQYVFQQKNADFHNVWQNEVQNHKTGGLLILGFRGSAKTEGVTTANSLFEIGKNVNTKIKIVTETDELSENIVSRIGNTILRNERYHEVFPQVKQSPTGSWNKHALTVERSQDHKDPTVQASSITAASTGGRSYLIHFDDVVGNRNALLYPGLRSTVKESFYSNWLPTLDPLHGRWIMTATPWHVEDLVTELRQNRRIKKTPEVWVDQNFKTPWPERFTSEYFKQCLAEYKLRGYNRAFRGIALSDEETWLNVDAIKSCIDRNLKVYDVLQSDETVRFTGVDLGHRDGNDHCPSVIFTVARTPNGKRIPVDIKISNNSSALDIARTIIKTQEAFKSRLIMVENNGAQKYLMDILTGLGPKGLPVEGQYTGSQKVDINIGVPALLAEIESGQWVIPFGSGGSHDDDVCECSTCKWIGELKNYPLARTDTVMASWLALCALKKVMERAHLGGNFSIWEF